ncbi:hypothetical protein NET02_02525 [Thermomicrobiaceae bacterium CFH 74404]|uniref:Uncharacterized protein n=1 Tax=Thermalbibacter longus TaxID=2951981 RepID=A0AA41W9W9_9BACT|nr:hypothetical protein [Thermalbibacter longus]MCM8748016.1 hypothetical protein [Thermalbibacter longus]
MTMSRRPRRTFTETDLLDGLREACSPECYRALLPLYNWLKGRALRYWFGGSEIPTANFAFLIQGKEVRVLNLSPWGSEGQKKTPLLEVNFKNLVNASVSHDVLRRFAERLADIPDPEFQKRLNQTGESEFPKEPSIWLNTALPQPGAVETIQRAIDELLSSASGTSRA